MDKAIEILHNHKKAQSIVGICATEGSNPAFLVYLHNDFIRPYENTDFSPLRRQDIKTVYFFEGSLYIKGLLALVAPHNQILYLTLFYNNQYNALILQK